ncbi:restriction modification system DNA specificity domain protein [Elysia marginata]|uniref:Restriction modification system DNA specificity domain protein n=1 Tax=Elysia marginata TaxID=1093978 RepID=A0AAV4HET7_9GAST|nr:restriction modification system DNA specificity domain protein [Elysia marginata]
MGAWPGTSLRRRESDRDDHTLGKLDREVISICQLRRCPVGQWTGVSPRHESRVSGEQQRDLSQIKSLADRQTDRQAGRLTDRQTISPSVRQAGRQKTGRHSDNQTGRQAGRRTGRQTDKQIGMKTERQVSGPAATRPGSDQARGHYITRDRKQPRRLAGAEISPGYYVASQAGCAPAA